MSRNLILLFLTLVTTGCLKTYYRSTATFTLKNNTNKYCSLLLKTDDCEPQTAIASLKGDSAICYCTKITDESQSGIALEFYVYNLNDTSSFFCVAAKFV